MTIKWFDYVVSLVTEVYIYIYTHILYIKKLYIVIDNLKEKKVKLRKN